MSDKLKITQDGYWVGGINSLLFPTNLQQGEYQWGINIDNTGGIISPRAGLSYRIDTFNLMGMEPRGIHLFKTADGRDQLVFAAGGNLYYSDFPLANFFQLLPGIPTGVFGSSTGPVNMEPTVRSAKTNNDGTTALLDEPIPYLIIQDGMSRAVAWDGLTAQSLNPGPPDINSLGQIVLFGNQTPVGLWMKWIGGRLWVAKGRKVRASNIGDPLTFTGDSGQDLHAVDTSVEGAFYLSDDCTGMASTPDLKSLLVYTDSNTTAFQADIFDRSQWNQTPDFQKVILPNIGNAAGKSVINQYGLTWWYSHGGLIGLDSALQTYRTSRVHYRDRSMNRDKANLSDDISGIAVGAYGNTLLVSVPAGDGYNAHTWMLNQSIEDDPQTTGHWASAWTGVKPVEWAIGVIKGQQRCFFLSRDIHPDTGEVIPNIWEAFMGDQYDISFQRVQKFPCMFETKILGLTDELRRADHAEIDLIEMSGTVHIEGWYAGVRGGYKKILDKTIAATAGGANSIEQVTAHAELTATGVQGTLDILVNDNSGFDTNGILFLSGLMFGYSKTVGGFSLNAPLPRDFAVGEQVTQIEFQYPASTEEVTSMLSTTTTGDVDIGDTSIATGSLVGFTDPSGVVFYQNHAIFYTAIGGGTLTLANPITFQILSGSTLTQPNYSVIAGLGPTLLQNYRPQYRTVKTQNVAGPSLDECSTCGVESYRMDKIDRGFSILLKWTGKASIAGIRLFIADPNAEEMRGACEDDEDTARYVTYDGCGSKSDNILQTDTYTFGANKSRYLRVFTPKSLEEPYTAYLPPL